MRKTLISLLTSLLCSHLCLAMGTVTLITATATPAVMAQTLNPPELIYEDEKVKVEKVWEKEFPGVEKVIWGEVELGINEEVPQTAYVLETNTQENKKKIIFPKIIVLNQLIQVMNFSGQKIKEIPGLIFMGKSEDNKYFIAGKPTRKLTEYESEKTMSVPWEATVFDDYGNELWKPEPRIYGRVQPLSADKIIDFESYPGGGSAFSIIGKDGFEKNLDWAPADGMIPDPKYKISGNGENIIGCVGKKVPEIACWNIRGEYLWKKVLDKYEGYFCPSESEMSSNGKLFIIKLFKTPKFKRDSRPKQIVLQLDMNGNLIKEFYLEKTGDSFYTFSENVSFLLYLTKNTTMIINLNGGFVVDEFEASKKEMFIDYSSSTIATDKNVQHLFLLAKYRSINKFIIMDYYLKK